MKATAEHSGKAESTVDTAASSHFPHCTLFEQSLLLVTEMINVSLGFLCRHWWLLQQAAAFPPQSPMLLL